MKKEILLAELYPKRFCGAPKFEPIRRTFTPTLSSVSRGCELLHEPRSERSVSRRLPVHSVKHFPGSAVQHGADDLKLSRDVFVTALEVSNDCVDVGLKPSTQSDSGVSGMHKASIFKPYAYNQRPQVKLYSSEFFSSFASRTQAQPRLAAAATLPSQASLIKKKQFQRKEIFANSKQVQESINYFMDYRYGFMNKWHSVNGQRLRSSEERLTDQAEDLGQRTH